MASILNGMALHGGFRPVGSTFLVFADYARPALRLAALMGQPVVHVYTHDSIGLGEDGPTHQPIEHLASMRAMPNVAVLRPADANEVIEAWHTAFERSGGPTVMALSRQGLPVLDPGERGWIARTGARRVHAVGAAEAPALVLVATGSEVALAMAAADLLAADGRSVAVVSMPWRERFLALPRAQRAQLLPPGVPVVVVEAGVTQGWDALAPAACVTIDTFGASGKGSAVQEHFGFTAPQIAERARAVLAPGGSNGHLDLDAKAMPSSPTTPTGATA
jgi:transketolase